MQRCNPVKFVVAHERRVQYLHVAPLGVTLEMVQDPLYWGPVVMQLKSQPWPLIEVIGEDGSWECMLRCYATTDHSAKVRLLRKWADDRKFVRPILPPGYEVVYLPGQGWRAVDDKHEEICRGQMVEAEALLAAAAHAEKMKASAAIDAKFAPAAPGTDGSALAAAAAHPASPVEAVEAAPAPASEYPPHSSRRRKETV
jgi:hypothetical protein